MKVTTSQSSDKQIIISKLIALGLAPLPVAPFKPRQLGRRLKSQSLQARTQAILQAA